MTPKDHLEISRKLALAIGWKPERVHTHLHGTDYAISIVKPDEETALRLFDYRDWNVIGPIAERFDCFPRWNGWSWECVGPTDYISGNTPQLAIARAVIAAQGVK